MDSAFVLKFGDQKEPDRSRVCSAVSVHVGADEEDKLKGYGRLEGGIIQEPASQA